MNLADKPIYPVLEIAGKGKISEDNAMGITYKEALVLALASNPEMATVDGNLFGKFDAGARKTASKIILQADAIIKKMEGV